MGQPNSDEIQRFKDGCLGLSMIILAAPFSLASASSYQG